MPLGHENRRSTGLSIYRLCTGVGSKLGRREESLQEGTVKDPQGAVIAGARVAVPHRQFRRLGPDATADRNVPSRLPRRTLTSPAPAFPSTCLLWHLDCQLHPLPRCWIRLNVAK